MWEQMSECLLFNTHIEQLNQLYQCENKWVNVCCLEPNNEQWNQLFCSHIDIADLTANYGS
jgi:hypothetical protein